MKELTKEQFKQEIEALVAQDRHFNVESDDAPVRLIMYGCVIEVDFDCGIDGVMTVHKPNTGMEVELDFSVIDTIEKEDEGSYRLTFNNGMSDAVIDIVW